MKANEKIRCIENGLKKDAMSLINYVLSNGANSSSHREVDVSLTCSFSSAQQQTLSETLCVSQLRRGDYLIWCKLILNQKMICGRPLQLSDRTKPVIIWDSPEKICAQLPSSRGGTRRTPRSVRSPRQILSCSPDVSLPVLEKRILVKGHAQVDVCTVKLHIAMKNICLKIIAYNIFRFSPGLL